MRYDYENSSKVNQRRCMFVDTGTRILPSTCSRLVSGLRKVGCLLRPGRDEDGTTDRTVFDVQRKMSTNMLTTGCIHTN